MAKLHISEITLKVGLDENRVPEKLTWSAEDGGIDNEEAKAMLLSVWDSKNKESLKIDLVDKRHAGRRDEDLLPSNPGIPFRHLYEGDSG